MNAKRLSECLGQKVTFFDRVTRGDVEGNLDYDEKFKIYFINFGELAKYRPVVCGEGDSHFVVDGRIESYAKLTKNWDRYDNLLDYGIQGRICAINENDFDKGGRITRFEVNTGKILKEDLVDCLE